MCHCFTDAIREALTTDTINEALTTPTIIIRMRLYVHVRHQTKVHPEYVPLRESTYVSTMCLNIIMLLGFGLSVDQLCM